MKIKDSGERREFETGSVRDTSVGKGRCDLLPLGILGEFLSDTYLINIEEYLRTGSTGFLWDVIEGLVSDEYGDCFYHLMLDVAKQYEDGARKYQERNWEKGQPLHVYIDSGVRHYLKYRCGYKDEPHLRAFVWNILGAIWTHKNKPELIDLPYKTMGDKGAI